MTLSSWIVKTGPKTVARLLKVDPSTISQWKNLNAVPRPETMVKIYKLSRGRVSYKSIVECYTRKNF